MKEVLVRVGKLTKKHGNVQLVLSVHSSPDHHNVDGIKNGSSQWPQRTWSQIRKCHLMREYSTRDWCDTVCPHQYLWNRSLQSFPCWRNWPESLLLCYTRGRQMVSRWLHLKIQHLTYSLIWLTGSVSAHLRTTAKSLDRVKRSLLLLGNMAARMSVKRPEDREVREHGWVREAPQTENHRRNEQSVSLPEVDDKILTNATCMSDRASW